MRFLADEGVDRLVVSRLREAGHDVSYVPEFAPSSADIDILAISLSEDRVLITEDLDFGELVYRDKRPAYGIVLVRIHEIGREARVTAVMELVNQQQEDLVGKFVTLMPDEARIRPLPR